MRLISPSGSNQTVYSFVYLKKYHHEHVENARIDGQSDKCRDELY